MLKRTLFAVLITACAAHADSVPILQHTQECNPPGRAQQEVRLEFTITETGAVANPHIVQSSGNAEADAYVLQCFANHVYKPATHNDVPVAFAAHDSFMWGVRVEEMTGERRAIAKLERDADYRCRKLYPMDRRFLTTEHISLVVLSRKEGGEIQMAVTQSAGERADKNAVACLKEILKDHDDLPATFAEGITINWSHR